MMLPVGPDLGEGGVVGEELEERVASMAATLFLTPDELLLDS